MIHVARRAARRVEAYGTNLPRLFAEDALARRALALAVDTAALIGAVIDVVPVAEVLAPLSQPNPTSFQARTECQALL